MSLISTSSLFLSVLLLHANHHGSIVSNAQPTAAPTSYATCDECWCIPDNGGTGECPTDDRPRTDFPSDWVYNLQTLTPIDPPQLYCDPYHDQNCDTVPALQSGSYCAIEMIPDDGCGSTCPTQYSYKLVTIDSEEEAANRNLTITHETPCGTCSTLQDLAAYILYPDLTSVGKQCGSLASTNFNAAVQCYMDQVGFTEACATTWVYDSLNTSNHCWTPCARASSRNFPNNGPAPTCDLNSCIQCDEDDSGPIFKEFSGRTRRDSGLLSGIARNCSEIASIQQQDPCDGY